MPTDPMSVALEQMRTQNAAIDARQQEQFRIQREQNETLVAQQQGAQISQRAMNEAQNDTNSALFYLQQWQTTVNKIEVNAHAAELNLDPVYQNPEMPNELFSQNNNTDSGWLTIDNPFDQTPQEAAQEATARANNLTRTNSS